MPYNHLKIRKPFSGKVGLALGGGAVLGAAHIGVLKAFEASEIEIDALSGTSIGALVASLYAFGVRPDEIEEMASDMDWLDISAFTLSRMGLLNNNKIGKLIREAVGDRTIEESPIPLALLATDVSEGRPVILSEGSLANAVMASTSVPGIFKPVTLNDKMLVDGGLVENVPISALAKLGARTRIGVDLNANRQYQTPEDMIDVLINSIDIAIDHSARVQSDEADLIICPNVHAYSRTDSSAVAELIATGEKAAEQAIHDHFYIGV